MQSKRYKHFLVVPDSFKGTMSALDVCRIMSETLKERFPEAQVTAIPVADGGEGTVDAFLGAMGGERRSVVVKGPHFEPLESFYGLLPNKTAVIEMAAAAGLPLVGENRQVERTTTYGVGELLIDAMNHGADRIIVGLGGSATNDGGCGMAAACGARFLNKKGEAFVPVGGTLNDIDAIDLSVLDSRIAKTPIIAMCDIDNPLCGFNGAAAMFGPQKGATPDQVVSLDAALEHLAKIVDRDLGKDVLALKGGGAAGGMGAGLVAFFGAELQMGIETVLDTTGFDDLVKDADLVFSGEGCFDAQSLHGKVVLGVARRCKEAGKPLIVVAGVIDDAVIPNAVKAGVSHLCSINRTGVPLDIALKHPRANLAHTMGLLTELLANVKGEKDLAPRIHL